MNHLPTEENATIRRTGTIMITDRNKKTVQISLTYATCDVMRLLDHGHTIEEIVSILNEGEK